jgi:hypothetical protein
MRIDEPQVLAALQTHCSAAAGGYVDQAIHEA